MTVMWSFAAGLALTVGISILIVGYLRRPLQQLLTDLCGSQERAAFWAAFSAVTLGIVPVIFALAYEPTTDLNAPVFLQIAQQLKWALIGMVASVLMLGWILGRFILKSASKP